MKKGIKILIIALLSPILLFLSFLLIQSDASAYHNNEVVEVLFLDKDIPLNTPSDFSEYLEAYKAIFKEIDEKANDLENLNKPLDTTLIKSMIFVNYLESNYPPLSTLDIDKLLECFYYIQDKDDEEIKLIVTTDTNIILTNLKNVLNINLFDKQDAYMEIYYVALTGKNQSLDNYVPMDTLLHDAYIESEKSNFIGDVFVSPFDDDWKQYVTSEFGSRNPIVLPDGSVTADYHTGIDMGKVLGTRVHAIASGKVVAVQYTNIGLGFYIVIDHGSRIFSVYGHLSRILVEVNDEVLGGDLIAEVGSTGYSTGPHLHLEIIKDRTYINPRIYLP